MNETGRDNLAIRTGKRALKYEEKLSKQERNTILGECWRIQEKREKERNLEGKKEFLETRGLSIERYRERLQRGESI